MSNNVYPIYTYISEKAGYDPAKTFYVCAPERDAATLEGLEQFALRSGWQQCAEEQGAILVMPVAPHGWHTENAGLLKSIYQQTRNSFHTRSGKSPWGRQGSLWCWETVLYLAGYDEGADFAGRAVVQCPNMFAAAALVGGAPDDFSAGEQPSDHWFVRNVDKPVKNKDIPVCLWMLGADEGKMRTAAEYFQAVQPVSGQMGELAYRLWQSPENLACQVRVFPGSFCANPQLAQFLVHELFSHVVRWKDGPDGTLEWVDSKEEFYQDPRFRRHTVSAGGEQYDFFVHIPDGMTPDQAAGLPLVFTVHGRGEPAWMFTTKNGWDTLADETQAFVLVSPDSPGNIWFLDRDVAMFGEIIHTMEQMYSIDTERVYLTGFSNGGMIVREMGVRCPWLFAGISPWNAPRMDSITLHKEDSPAMPDHFGLEMEAVVAQFVQDGYELPCCFCYGDSDPAASPKENLLLDTLLTANGCTGSAHLLDSTEAYPVSAGYIQGQRMSTTVYSDQNGVDRVSMTVMSEMPHGAIHDESRMVWNFLKRFSRRKGEKQVTVKQ